MVLVVFAEIRISVGRHVWEHAVVFLFQYPTEIVKENLYTPTKFTLLVAEFTLYSHREVNGFLLGSCILNMHILCTLFTISKAYK